MAADNLFGMRARSVSLPSNAAIRDAVAARSTLSEMSSASFHAVASPVSR